jgi:tetratricopeptide (TPR) repeat protein
MKQKSLCLLAILAILAMAACAPGADGRAPTTTAGFDHYVQGLRLFNQKQFQQAVDELSLAITANPQNGRAFYARANAYGMLGLQDKAISDFKQAVTLDPKDDPSYFGLAIAYANLGQRSDAIAALDKAIALANQADYYGLRGTLYAEQNDPQHAIPDLEKALSLGLDAQQSQRVQSLLQLMKTQAAP